MKIKSLTKKKVEELKKLYENKLAVYNELEVKNEKDLWKEDLNKFLEVYKAKLSDYNSKLNEQFINLKGGSKKTASKKK